MTRTPSRHLDARRALDYLEQSLPADARREVEEHLGEPCVTCHERVRELGLLIERMRLDRVGEVPPELHAVAVAQFQPTPQTSPARRMLEELARLVFDSWDAPLAVATRRAVGEARRLRFTLGDGRLELECELEGDGFVALRGRLELDDAALHRIEVTTAAERQTARADASGAFALERVPAGNASLLVIGPSAQYRLPPLVF